MILAKIAYESTFFPAFFYHRLKFWSLNFTVPQLLQQTFASHGFLFNNVYLHVYYHPSKFVVLVANHPVYIYIYMHIAEKIQTFWWPRYIFFYLIESICLSVYQSASLISKFCKNSVKATYFQYDVMLFRFNLYRVICYQRNKRRHDIVEKKINIIKLETMGRIRLLLGTRMN